MNNDSLLIVETHEDPFTQFDEEIVISSKDQEVSVSTSPYTLALKRKDFETEKELNSFIKSCERLIRISPEYRIWTDFIRESLGFSSCQLTGEIHTQTTVDIHHHPFTLWSLVKCAIMKRIANAQEFCSYDISSEIIQLHYDLKISFCVLVSSLHEKYHRGFLQIPMELIRGNYQYIIDHYMRFLEDDEIEYIMSKLSINKDNCGWTTSYSWVEPKVSDN